mmetsp:Transcript_17887/g.22803  ORF Transcript_17887/g.22803 Transcript_17887/m.22803 type:complete len:106 (-) Transcript_17887:1968-2285(-)
MIPFMEDDSEDAIDAFDERQKKAKWVVTSVLLGACFFIGFSTDLGTILSLTGAVFSTINVYIVPSILMISTNRTTWDKKLYAPIILVMGVFVGIIALIKEMNIAG